MDSESYNISQDLSDCGSLSGDRSFCLHSQLPTSQVLLQEQGPSSLESGCSIIPVVGSSSVCLSSVFHPSQSTREGCCGESRDDVGGSILASEDMVPKVTVATCGASKSSSVTGGLGFSTHISSSSSKNRESASHTLAAFREKGKQAGLSSRASELSAESLRESTRSSYDSKLECYLEWCEKIPCDPNSASLGQVADFLVFLFDKGLAISTIRVYRSAIASYHSGFQDGSSVSNSPVLSRLCRSFFLKRPPVKTLLPAWSLPRVLQRLSEAPFEPLHKASLHHLSIKSAFLVAIASGHRISTLHALSIDPGHLRWEPSGVRLTPRPGFLAKNQSSSSRPVEIFLPSIPSFSSVQED